LDSEEARSLYGRSVVVDGLNVSNWASPAVFQSLRAGGVTAINATSAVFETFPQALDNIAEWSRRFETYAKQIVPITSVADIDRAKVDGRTGIIIGWQNAAAIENDLSRLALFHRLGLRIVQLTYNERNLLGNGCWERVDGGLSRFGEDAVREVNRLGILIDLSHVGDRSTMDAIELSDKPVAVTHSNARGYFDHPRNKPDDALKAVAEGGGVIGATSWPPFLRNGFASALADFGEAIDDLVERVGIDHVGIGSDYTQDRTKEWFDVLMSFQGTRFNPRRREYPDTVTHTAGLETPAKLPNVAVELARRGYAKPDIVKVLGGNWMRLFGEVWGA
jgi:membrane dipeptidase